MNAGVADHDPSVLLYYDGDYPSKDNEMFPENFILCTGGLFLDMKLNSCSV